MFTQEKESVLEKLLKDKVLKLGQKTFIKLLEVGLQQGQMVHRRVLLRHHYMLK